MSNETQTVGRAAGDVVGNLPRIRLDRSRYRTATADGCVGQRQFIGIQSAITGVCGRLLQPGGAERHPRYQRRQAGIHRRADGDVERLDPAERDD